MKNLRTYFYQQNDTDEKISKCQNIRRILLGTVTLKQSHCIDRWMSFDVSGLHIMDCMQDLLYWRPNHRKYYQQAGGCLKSK